MKQGERQLAAVVDELSDLSRNPIGYDTDHVQLGYFHTAESKYNIHVLK